MICRLARSNCPSWQALFFRFASAHLPNDSKSLINPPTIVIVGVYYSFLLFSTFIRVLSFLLPRGLICMRILQNYCVAVLAIEQFLRVIRAYSSLCRALLSRVPISREARHRPYGSCPLTMKYSVTSILAGWPHATHRYIDHPTRAGEVGRGRFAYRLSRSLVTGDPDPTTPPVLHGRAEHPPSIRAQGASRPSDRPRSLRAGDVALHRSTRRGCSQVTLGYDLLSLARFCCPHVSAEGGQGRSQPLSLSLLYHYFPTVLSNSLVHLIL